MPDQPNDIDTAAVTWAALAHGGFASAQERRDCQAWLEADARHLGAYARALAVLEVVSGAHLLTQQPCGAMQRFEDVEPPRSMTRRYLLGGLAAIMVGMLAVPNFSTDAQAAIYRTERGQQRTISLEDGTALTLNTQTRLTIETRYTRRQLRLGHGEIALAVPAGSGPVTLAVSGIELMPHQAEIAVSSLSAGSADLMVVSGSVQLRAGDDRVTIEAGRFVRFDSGHITEIKQISGDEVRARLAWRKGMIDFNDVTLAEAARRFARYNSTAIELGDDDVANQRITGVFSLGRPREFADAVAKALDLSARHADTNVMLQKK